MFRTPAPSTDVPRHITELPAEYEVQRLAEHWVIAGPTGIFTVGRTDGEVQRDAEHLSLLAHELRASLSRMMPWVPFVDALLVAQPEQVADLPASALACTVVGLGMLPVALTCGPQTIDPDELRELYRVLPLAINRLHHHGPDFLATA